MGLLTDLVSRDPNTGEYVARVALSIRSQVFSRGSVVPPSLLFGEGQQPDLWDSLYQWTVEGEVTDTLVRVSKIYRD